MRKTGILIALLLVWGGIYFFVHDSMSALFETGDVKTFTLRMDRDLLAKSNIPTEWHNSIDNKCRAALYIPSFLQNTTAEKILITYGAGGENIASLNSYKTFSDQLGCVLVTPEHRRHDYDDRAHYYYTLRLIEYLKDREIVNSHPTIVLAGFSGGGKVALAMAAYGGDLFDGVVAIGVNDDIASMAYKWLPNENALDTPIVILNADDDRIVQLFTNHVISSMNNTGFRKVSRLSYTGGHRIPSIKTRSTLQLLFSKNLSSATDE